MSASPTTHITRIAFAIACTIVASLAFTGAAWANSPTITTVDGNPSCADVGAGTELFKVEPVSTKKFSRGSFSGDVVVRQGQVFDFTVSNPVDVVIVKGGPNANVYRYTPETTSGSGLHAPMNGSQPYGLSHISFCQDFAPPPPPPPAPCTPGGPDTKADGTPCNPPAPCTEGGSDMKDDGTPCNPPAPCTPGGSDMKADGTPCVPPPPAPPVTTVASSSKAPDVLGVVGEIRAAANASMRSPRRCVTKPFTQVFTGRGIKKITVRVNGRVVRTLSGGQTRYSVSVDPRKYAGGVMRVTARVEYVASSGKSPQTLRATVLRCAVQATGPQFTG
jgi:hypothetical protein